MQEVQWVYASLDERTVQELLALESESSDFLVELIGIFLEVLPSGIQSLDQKLLAQDALAAGRQAHSLKSNCGSIGALQLLDDFKLIEKYCAENNLVKANQLLGLAKTHFEQVGKDLALLERSLPALRKAKKTSD